jgi:queuine/archaeosine tRNA-ribosyltransferase
MIAIPERELGAGIFERARMVRRIREALASLPFYQPVHLLGTGNPWTIAILAAAGADSFDGLEWCRIVVDHDSGRLHHDQHFDFFSFQGRRGDSRIATDVINDPGINFAGKVAFHNLAYYSGFADELKHAAIKGDFEAFVMGTLGKDNTVALKKQMPELFR